MDADRVGSPGALPRQEIWRGLLLGQRSMLLRLGGRIKREFGLSLAQYEALLALHEAPQHTMPSTQLARELLYSSGSASNLIARLESLGHVQRAPGPDDARTQLVTLTADGEDLIVRATAAHVADLRAEFDPLVSDDEVDVVLGFARRLAQHERVRSTPAPLPEDRDAAAGDATP